MVRVEPLEQRIKCWNLMMKYFAVAAVCVRTLVYVFMRIHVCMRACPCVCFFCPHSSCFGPKKKGKKILIHVSYLSKDCDRHWYVKKTLHSVCPECVVSPRDVEKTSTFRLWIHGSVAIAARLLGLVRYGMLQQIHSHFLFCSSAVDLLITLSALYTLFFLLSSIGWRLIQKHIRLLHDHSMHLLSPCNLFII